MGPSIVAVLATMGKLIREGEVNPTSEYFKTYKMNVLPALKYWLIQLTIMLILSVEIFYSVNRSNIFLPLFLFLLIVCLFIICFSCYFILIFYFDFLDFFFCLSFELFFTIVSHFTYRMFVYYELCIPDYIEIRSENKKRVPYCNLCEF